MIKNTDKACCYALYDRNGPCQKLCKGVPDNAIHVHRESGVLSRKCLNVNVNNYSLYSCYTPVWGARKGCWDRKFLRNLAEASSIAIASSSGPGH
jgi:hypothetical protein